MKSNKNFNNVEIINYNNYSDFNQNYQLPNQTLNNTNPIPNPHIPSAIGFQNHNNGFAPQLNEHITDINTTVNKSANHSRNVSVTETNIPKAFDEYNANLNSNVNNAGVIPPQISAIGIYSGAMNNAYMHHNVPNSNFDPAVQHKIEDINKPAFDSQVNQVLGNDTFNNLNNSNINNTQNQQTFNLDSQSSAFSQPISANTNIIMPPSSISNINEYKSFAFDATNKIKPSASSNVPQTDSNSGYPTLDSNFAFDGHANNNIGINPKVPLNNINEHPIKSNAFADKANINNANHFNHGPSHNESGFDFDFNSYDKVENFKEIANKKAEDMFKKSNFDTEWDFE